MKQLKGVRPAHAQETNESVASNSILIKLPRLAGVGAVESRTDTGLRRVVQQPQMSSALRRAITQYDNYVTQVDERESRAPIDLIFMRFSHLNSYEPLIARNFK